MRLGFKFYTGNGKPITLWTPFDQPVGSRMKQWGAIQQAKVSYADFEISECTVDFTNPSDDLIRALMAIVIAEPTPLDMGLPYLSASLWIQDPRFGYTPQPIFYGLILDLAFKDGAVPGATVTMHDFTRLQILERDVQDYQNLTDADIATMLALRLNEAAGTADGKDVVSEVRIDPDALKERRTSSTVGAVRRWQARLLDLSSWDRLKTYARRLGFTISRAVKTNYAGEEYWQIDITPVQGAMERVAGTYRRGDGELISFNPRYSPPGPVMTRNTMSKRFDAVHEIMMLENAKGCVSLNPEGNVVDKGGNVLPLGAIKGPTVLMDKDGKPLTLEEYQQTTGPTFLDNLRNLGAGSTEPLRAYHDRISYRKGVQVPGSVPVAAAQDGSAPVQNVPALQENLADAGSLYWRYTAQLATRLNPFLTTTDYLKIEGYGVWDANWAIRSFSHTLGDNPQSNFDLTFGDPVRVSG